VAAGARLANAIVVASLTVPTTFVISGARGDVGDPFIVRRVYELLFEGVSIAGILLRMAVSTFKRIVALQRVFVGKVCCAGHVAQIHLIIASFP
jgi:hypothetical protein